MQDKESLIEKDYRLLRNAVIYSLLPVSIKIIISLLFLFVSFFGLISLMRTGTLIGEFGCIIGGIIVPVSELIKIVIIDLPVYAVTGNSHGYSSASYVCDKHSWIPYAVCSGIVIFIGFHFIWACVLFARYARLTSAQKHSVHQQF